MVFIIGIAGPSACGKSTLCEELVKFFPGCALVHLDDYWHDPDTFPRVLGFKNWELPECLDFDTLYRNLAELKQGKATVAPEWIKGSYPPSTKTICAAQTIIVEGFRLFYEERIRSLLDYKIYVDIPPEVAVHRRLARLRHGKKGRELYYREVVLPEETKYGVPTKKYADVVVDGTLPVPVMIEELTTILKAVKKENFER